MFPILASYVVLRDCGILEPALGAAGYSFTAKLRVLLTSPRGARLRNKATISCARLNEAFLRKRDAIEESRSKW